MTQIIKAKKDAVGQDITCEDCIHYEGSVCGHYYSDHFGHTIATCHPACMKFERRD